MAKLLDITEKRKRDVRQFNVPEEDQSEFDRGVMKIAQEKLFKRDKALVDMILKKVNKGCGKLTLTKSDR